MGNSKTKPHILADRCGLLNPIRKSKHWVCGRSKQTSSSWSQFLLAHTMCSWLDQGWDVLLFPVLLVILMHCLANVQKVLRWSECKHLLKLVFFIYENSLISVVPSMQTAPSQRCIFPSLEPNLLRSLVLPAFLSHIADYQQNRRSFLFSHQ